MFRACACLRWAGRHGYCTCTIQRRAAAAGRRRAARLARADEEMRRLDGPSWPGRSFLGARSPSRRANGSPVHYGPSSQLLPVMKVQQLLPPTRRLPKWWLFCLPLYWFPQSLAWSLIETYLLPFQVAALAGDAHKHMALSLMVVASNVGVLAAPVMGWLSDTFIDLDGRRCRRPFVVVGQVLFGFAVLFMAESYSVAMFLCAYLLYTLTAAISGPPYAAILSELVPTEQRGTYGGACARLLAATVVHYIGII
eukprot:COSAG01_NODE_5670_length_4108_cov_15.236219_1_plen_253_part_00